MRQKLEERVKYMVEVRDISPEVVMEAEVSRATFFLGGASWTDPQKYKTVY